MLMVVQPIFTKATRRILALALAIFVFDQFTKWLVLHTIYEGDEIDNRHPRIFQPRAPCQHWRGVEHVYRQQHHARRRRARRTHRAFFGAKSFSCAPAHGPARARPGFRRHHRQPHRPACCPDATPSWTSCISICNGAVAVNRLISLRSTSPTPPSAPASR